MKIRFKFISCIRQVKVEGSFSCTSRYLLTTGSIYANFNQHLTIVESLSALPSCLQRFLKFPRFLHPGTVFGVEHEFTGTPARKSFFVARCTCKVFNRLRSRVVTRARCACLWGEERSLVTKPCTCKLPSALAPYCLRARFCAGRACVRIGARGKPA